MSDATPHPAAQVQRFNIWRNFVLLLTALITPLPIVWMIAVFCATG